MRTDQQRGRLVRHDGVRWGRRPAVALALALAGAGVLPLTGCGLPADGAVHAVQPSDVPYDLLDPAPQTTPAASAPRPDRAPQPEAYLLDARHLLVPVPGGLAAGRPSAAQQPPATPADPPRDGAAERSASSSTAEMTATTVQLVQLLATLEMGPTPQQRAQGLGTALTSGVTIRLLSVHDTVAAVEVQSAFKEPSAGRLPLAIGQLVLTATSVPGVAAVRLFRDGAPLEVPLPGGALTTEPLRRGDYAVFITHSQQRTKGPVRASPERSG